MIRPNALLLVLLLFACYEDQEACLDPLAQNFDVTADVNCCCTYPDLRFSYAHTFGDSNFVRAQWYTNDLQQIFRVDTFRMYWHNVALTNKTGDRAQVLDTITIKQELQRDDYILIDIRNVGSDVGAFSPSDTFINVSFNPGIGQELDIVDVDVASGHPLSALSGIFDANSGYADAEMKVTTDSTNETSIYVRFDLDDVSEINFPIEVEKEAGEELILSFLIDYEILLGSYDFGNLDSLGLINHIKSTWTQSIIFE